jgi:glutamate dehydrogenase (NADP+)
MVQYATGGKESFEGKRVAISGSGNVAQYAALKAIELRATVISLSDSKGSIIAKEGKSITPALISHIADLKVKRQAIDTVGTSEQYKDSVTYIKNDQPWIHVSHVDVALPCATQNEVSGSDAAKLLDNGCRYIAEGSNMGCTQDAIDAFETVRKDAKGLKIWYAPGR